MDQSRIGKARQIAQRAPWSRATTAIVAIFSLALAGCFQQPMPDLSNLPDAPANYPDTKYQQLLADRWTVYRIDPAATLLQIRVYKEGAMARLGHNHIVSTSQLQGRIASKADAVAADLYVRLDQLDVDRPELRAAAGDEFASVPDAEDVAGTRANMLSAKVLDATQYPFVQLQVHQLTQTIGGQQLATELTLHGVTERLLVPVVIERHDQVLTVRGQLRDFRPSAFAVPQFSVLGGALGVADRVDISFELTATSL